jgi:hypothetical protein
MNYNWQITSAQLVNIHLLFCTVHFILLPAFYSDRIGNVPNHAYIVAHSGNMTSDNCQG